MASDGTVFDGNRSTLSAPREITGIRSTRLYGMPLSSSMRLAAIAGCEPGIDVELRVGLGAAIARASYGPG